MSNGQTSETAKSLYVSPKAVSFGTQQISSAGAEHPDGWCIVYGGAADDGCVIGNYAIGGE